MTTPTDPFPGPDPLPDPLPDPVPAPGSPPAPDPGPLPGPVPPLAPDLEPEPAAAQQVAPLLWLGPVRRLRARREAARGTAELSRWLAERS